MLHPSALLEPANRPTAQTNDNSSSGTPSYTNQVIERLKEFYVNNPQIKESHGIEHALQVHQHSTKAIACHVPTLKDETSMEIEIASLLHDVDDSKYFPKEGEETVTAIYPNAISIMNSIQLPKTNQSNILQMIQLVSCSKNGNFIPCYISESKSYHLLIPRWSDRLEAVGAIGVVRCYQYNREHDLPLCSSSSPRAKTVDEVWTYATPQRFISYQISGGVSTDMISHYYDKLLHIARPPKDCVRNAYLEQMAEESCKELIEVCVRFGQLGFVDEEYICALENQLKVDAH